MGDINLDQILKIVIVGHVDHGKSTLIGRLLYNLKQIKDGKFEEINEICKTRGKEFEWAFLMDSLQTERNQGITIDTSQIFFKTKKRNYVLIDAPGHKEFIRNMITGASSADIAILIIDAEEGVKEQTKKHCYLLKILGISEVLVVINKMDKINFDEEKYNNVLKKIKNYLSNLKTNPFNFIPISAKRGDNISSDSKNTKWYKGKNLVEILDNYSFHRNFSDLPLRIPIQDIYKIKEKRIIVGRIESGVLKKNDIIFISPENKKTVVNSIETWPYENIEIAFADQCIGFTVKDQLFLERGNIISHQKNLPFLVNTFEANIFWISNKKLDLRKFYSLRLGTLEIKVSIQEIKKVVDTDNLKTKNKSIVNKNDVAEVIILSHTLIPVDNFKDNPRLGRFNLFDDFETVGGGIINLSNSSDQRVLTNKNNNNVTPFNYEISNTDRISKLSHRPGIVWLTGLSGSGKSTIANEIEKIFFLKGFKVFILDGDNLRNGLNKDLGFSPRDRMENIRRTAEVASLFSSAGFLVITCLISPYRSERGKAKSIKPDIFKEIYVKASLAECIQRDPKGLYALAKKGKIKNFTGIDAPYEEPNNPDLVLDTENNSLKKIIHKLEQFILGEFGIEKKK